MLSTAPVRLGAPTPVATPPAPAAPAAPAKDAPLAPKPAAPAAALLGASTIAGPDADELAAAAKAAPEGSPVVQPADPAQPGSGRLPGDVLKSELEKALKADPSARYAIDETSGSATFLAGTFKVDVRPGVGKRPPDLVAKEFFKAHGGMFGVAQDAANLSLLGVEKDDLGFKHYRYQQVHQGLPVFGQQVVVHAQGDVITSVGGRLTPVIDLGGTEPKLAVEDLQAKVRDAVAAAGQGEAAAVQFGATRQLGVYTTQDGTPHLAMELEVSNGRPDGRWVYYVDANTGDVLDHWATVHSALNRETFDAQSRQSRPGKLARKEGDGPVADDVVNKAHDNAKAVYDYLQERYKRDSIDGKGMKLTSTVHYGDKYNNAFWDGRQMTYGDGDGVRFKDLGNAIDVVGHEMMHGVTERTAGLRYQRQSGALNESWSDVFGNLIEKWEEQRLQPGSPDRDPNWLVGETIFTPGTDGDALRSMKAPGTAHPKDPQPAHMKDYKDTFSDNGGVHINSGIPNRAAYEVAQSLGADKLSDIWYRALTTYMTPTTQFVDASNVTVQAAADLFGKDSPEVAAVRTAWTNVGLAPTSGATAS